MENKNLIQSDENTNYDKDIDDEDIDDELTIDEVSDSKNNSKSGLLNNLEFKVQVVAGKVELSLAELQNLKKGDMIDIGELPPVVKLVINDVVIGSGYLVELNGRVGVKIANLNNNIQLC